MTEKVLAAIHDAGKVETKAGVAIVSKAVGAKLDEAKAAAVIKDASGLEQERQVERAASGRRRRERLQQRDSLVGDKILSFRDCWAWH